MELRKSVASKKLGRRNKPTLKGKPMGTIQSHIATIIHEVQSVLVAIDEQETDRFVAEIVAARRIVSCGAGRVGMAVRGFSMRLGHLGMTAATVGDSTAPNISEGDLLIVASGSGETQTIFDLVRIASQNKCRIAAITGNKNSRIAQLASTVVWLNAPSKTRPVEGINSIQPMTTLNEQCLTIYFDAVCLKLMEKLDETHETMWARHSNLE
jgi:6-phospho-3-hexuloisomerase